MRMPYPGYVDLWFCGAAIYYCKTGHFANPLLRFRFPEVESRYFVHFPIHQLLLGNWLKLFGISTESMLLFQCLCYSICSTCIVLILKKFDFPGWLSFVVVLLYAGLIVPQGLRSDAFSMAMFSLGLLMLTRYGFLRYFAGAFLLGLSCMSWPVLSAYVIPFAATVIYYNSQSAKEKSYWSRTAAAIAAGAIVIIVIFLITIDFRVSDFIHDFLMHTAQRRPSLLEAPGRFFELITMFYQWLTVLPSFTLFLCCLISALVTDLVHNRTRVLLIATAIGIAINIPLYIQDEALPGFFVWVCLAAVLADLKKTGKLRFAYIAILALVSLAAFTVQALAMVLVDRTLPGKDDQQLAQIRAYVKQHPEQVYVIDDEAARYIFDYNFPNLSIYWNEIAHGGLPKEYSSLKCIVSSKKKHYFPELPVDYPRLRIFGRVFNSIPARIYEPMYMYDQPASADNEGGKQDFEVNP